jgi:competence protein CoiA
VADIKTAQGIVIELQHSGMPLGELQSRESFYKRMIWIIDGKPFAKNFKIYPEQLPHPDSKILNDVVFEGPRATAFWRRSEQNPNSELVEIHSVRKIADDIAEDYRGHHFFSWTRPRNIWYAALSPVFIDFGGEELFLIKKYKPETHRVIEIVSKKALLEENGGSFSKD